MWCHFMLWTVCGIYEEVLCCHWCDMTGLSCNVLKVMWRDVATIKFHDESSNVFVFLLEVLIPRALSACMPLEKIRRIIKERQKIDMWIQSCRELFQILNLNLNKKSNFSHQVSSCLDQSSKGFVFVEQEAQTDHSPSCSYPSENF